MISWRVARRPDAVTLASKIVNSESRAGGTGADGALPVMQQVRNEARRRKVDLVVLPTAEAIGVLARAAPDTNAILHLTC